MSKRVEIHNFTRNLGYVSYKHQRFSDCQAALDTAFKDGYREAIVFNDATLNFKRWYYIANDQGVWDEEHQ